MDLIVGRDYSAPIAYLSDGTTFLFGTAGTYSNVETEDLTLADVNGDGAMDLLIAVTVSGTSSLEVIINPSPGPEDSRATRHPARRDGPRHCNGTNHNAQRSTHNLMPQRTLALQPPLRARNRIASHRRPHGFASQVVGDDAA